MAKIGMIGGLGPESTLDYYRLLIEEHRSKSKEETNPEIIIYSMDINKLLKLVEDKQWEKLTEYLIDGIKVLENSGADFAFISSNTPHIIFDKLRKLSSIPLISIVEKTCEHIKKSGIKKVALLGTKFTMESDFYEKACKKEGLEIFYPNEKEQEYIQNKLMIEIELGQFLEETRQGLLCIIKRMIEENSIEGVILGCTELPLILTKDEFGIPFFNTSKIHVESIIEHYLNISK